MIFFFSVQCNRGERWVGGEFISAERVVVFSDDGKAYLYKLPTNCIVESKDFKNRSKTQSGKFAVQKSKNFPVFQILREINFGI